MSLAEFYAPTPEIPRSSPGTIFCYDSLVPSCVGQTPLVQVGPSLISVMIGPPLQWRGRHSGEMQGSSELQHSNG